MDGKNIFIKKYKYMNIFHKDNLSILGVIKCMLE